VLALYGARLDLGEAPGGGCLAAFTLPGWIDPAPGAPPAAAPAADQAAVRRSTAPR
jgi:hypothetical protein